MAKVSLGLVFAFVVVAVALHSVLCEEEDPWKAMVEEATKAGFSPDTIGQAQKAIGDGSAAKAAEDTFGGASLNDWIQQASDMASARNSPAEAPQNLPDNEGEDLAPDMAPDLAPESSKLEAPAEEPNLTKTADSPEDSPTPESSKLEAPAEEPKLTKTADAPEESPTEAPQAQSPVA